MLRTCARSRFLCFGRQWRLIPSLTSIVRRMADAPGPPALNVVLDVITPAIMPGVSGRMKIYARSARLARRIHRARRSSEWPLSRSIRNSGVSVSGHRSPLRSATPGDGLFRSPPLSSERRSSPTTPHDTSRHFLQRAVPSRLYSRFLAGCPQTSRMRRTGGSLAAEKFQCS